MTAALRESHLDPSLPPCHDLVTTWFAPIWTLTTCVSPSGLLHLTGITRQGPYATSVA
jgi:hypothetical protein